AGGERGAGLAALEREVSELQRPMVERLRELGAGATIRQHILANAVSAELTPAGIAELAKRPDVRLIRLEREDQVTTGSSISPQARRAIQLPTALAGRPALSNGLSRRRVASSSARALSCCTRPAPSRGDRQ